MTFTRFARRCCVRYQNDFSSFTGPTEFVEPEENCKGEHLKSDQTGSQQSGNELETESKEGKRREVEEAHDGKMSLKDERANWRSSDVFSMEASHCHHSRIGTDQKLRDVKWSPNDYNQSFMFRLANQWRPVENLNETPEEESLTDYQR